MRLFFPFMLLAVMLFSLSGLAYASEAAFQVPAFIGEVVFPFLFERFPILGTIIFIVGASRLVIKPLMESLEDFFGYISYDRGSRKINAIRENKIYYWFSFVLDYFFSIKPKK